MANRLAQGYLHRYKRPFGKSLLDAYMHDTCYRKIYGSYRNQRLSRLRNEHHLPSRPPIVQPVEMSPHQTRSRSTLNQSDLTDNESTHASITDLFSTPISISVAATTNPNAELSARSCLFRPCVERVSFLEDLDEEYSFDFIPAASRTSGILYQTKCPMRR